MTKDVLVSVSGLHAEIDEVENGENESIEILNSGTYFFKDGIHYVFFEEVSEGFSDVTKTQIRLHGKESLEVIKKGVTNLHLIFEKGKRNLSRYTTPYGQLNLGIFTNGIMVDETENNINVKVEYAMDVNCAPVAECQIKINVKPRDAKDFSICEKMEF